jgi:hypothetical protein
MIDNNYFLITLFICILIIYLILPVPKIVFRLNDEQILNIKEAKCEKYFV